MVWDAFSLIMPQTNNELELGNLLHSLGLVFT